MLLNVAKHYKLGDQLLLPMETMSCPLKDAFGSSKVYKPSIQALCPLSRAFSLLIQSNLLYNLPYPQERYNLLDNPFPSAFKMACGAAPDFLRIDASEPLEKLVDSVKTYGCVIIKNFTTPEVLAGIENETRPWLQQDRPWQVRQESSPQDLTLMLKDI